MAVESKIISTVTTYSIVGNTIAITSAYQEDSLPDTLAVSIAESVGNQGGTPFIEGELLIKVKNYLDHIEYQLNADGDLILIINTGDELKYSIDLNGNLIYTT